MNVNLNNVDDIIRSYGKNPGGLIPVLLKIEELYGYISEEALSEVSDKLSVPPLRLKKIISFYNTFSFTPKARNVIRVCQGCNCSSGGGQLTAAKISEFLNIKPGETSPDESFTLELVPCQRLCAVGPVVIINDKVYSHSTADKIQQLLSEYDSSEL